jgi:plasmid stabilization system protein ParE
LALDRAAEIARYIAADRPTAAERWIDGLMRTVDGLARSPRRGRMVPEVGRAEIREVLYGPYRVIYRLGPKRLAILTVRHARRAFDAAEPGGGA